MFEKNVREWIQGKDILVIGHDIFSVKMKPKSLTHRATADEVEDKFDIIFWNEEVHIGKAQEMVKKGQKLLAKIEKILPNLRRIKYSDQDLDAFCELMVKKQPMEVANFLKDLLVQEQISKTQYDRVMDKYKLSNTQVRITFNIHPQLMKCLEKLNVGGRLIGLTLGSLFENVAFFESVITNPNYEFEESQKREGCFFFHVVKK